MAPAETLIDALAEGMPSPAPVISEGTTSIDPNGHDNGQVDGSFDRALLHALRAMRLGDFSVRLPGDQAGLEGKIADTFNAIVAANE
jgi:hypothetical protein